MRQLGDAYVKSEFRLHKTVTKSEQLEQFYVEWDSYLSHVKSTGREQESFSAGLVDADSQGNSNAGKFGRGLAGDVSLNEQQEEQLSNLKEEAYKASNPEGSSP